MLREDLTAVRVRTLKPPKEGRIEIADGVARGLTLRVTAKGKKTWALAYRVKGAGGINAEGQPLKGPMRRMTLGQYPAMNLADAREAAAKALARANDGHDPADERAEELVGPPFRTVHEDAAADRCSPQRNCLHEVGLAQRAGR